MGLPSYYVGLVLMMNGLGSLYAFEERVLVFINLMVAAMCFFTNALTFIQASQLADYYSAGIGFLFAITYLFNALNWTKKWDLQPYGWFSLFVAINAAAVAYLEIDWRLQCIWALWSLLWLTAFIEIILNKNLGRRVAYLQIFEGIVTA